MVRAKDYTERVKTLAEYLSIGEVEAMEIYNDNEYDVMTLSELEKSNYDKDNVEECGDYYIHDNNTQYYN